MLVKNKTVFLFHLSTITPAQTPNNMLGMVKDITTPATAVFDLEMLKTTIRSAKFNKLLANIEKNSERTKNRNGLTRRVFRIRFSFILSL